MQLYIICYIYALSGLNKSGIINPPTPHFLCARSYLLYTILNIQSNIFEREEKCHHCKAMKPGAGIYDILALLYNKESIHQSAERNEQPQDNVVKLHFRSAIQEKRPIYHFLENTNIISQLRYFCDQLLCKCCNLIVLGPASNE